MFFGSMGAEFARMGGSASVSAPVLTPVNTVAPLASGVQEVGETLSCTTGTWTNTPLSYAYQWFRGASPIGSATSATYVLVLADDLTLVSCRVTATNASGNGVAFSNALLIGLVPGVTVAPAVTGTAAIGSILSCTTGTWSGSPSSYAYQWYRNGSPIGSATAATYLLVAADNLANILCAVTATNVIGPGSAANSNTVVVAEGRPVNSVAPVASVVGAVPAAVGETLTVTTGTWSGSPSSFTYQWLRDGAPIPSATATTYLLVLADDGSSVTCSILATNAVGVSPVAGVSNAIDLGSSAPGPIGFTFLMMGER